jgi:hypothetical protein
MIRLVESIRELLRLVAHSHPAQTPSAVRPDIVIDWLTFGAAMADAVFVPVPSA